MTKQINLGDKILAEGMKFKLVKVFMGKMTEGESTMYIGLQSDAHNEVILTKESDSIDAYLSKLTEVNWISEKEYNEKSKLTKPKEVHLFESTMCDCGDFEAKEWNLAMREELSSNESFVSIEDCTDKETMYICPGCKEMIEMNSSILHVVLTQCEEYGCLGNVPNVPNETKNQHCFRHAKSMQPSS